MERDEFIREAARAIRPYLEPPAGPEAAASMDAELARLLSTSGDTGPLLAQLQSTTSTRQWWLDFLRGEGVPPEVGRVSGTVRTNLPGLGLPDLPRYACPRGDYVWYRRSPAIAVPSCPTHQLPLVSAPRAG